MALNAVELGYEYFPDPTKGRPVYFGSIYIGVVGLDPIFPENRLTIQYRQEDGTLVPAVQPVLTGAGGVPLYEGSPVQIMVDGAYSIKVLNSSDAQVYYRADSSDNSREIITPLDTLTELRANTDSTLLRVSLTGHTTEGDGGGGEFWLDTSDTTTADDNGINIVDSVSPRIGTWKRLYSGAINPRWFGAKGNGAADDTAAIQAALNAGSEVHLTLDAQGVYLVTFSNVFPASTPYSYGLLGNAGSRITADSGVIIKTAETQGQLFQINADTDDVSIDGIFFQGAGLSSNTVTNLSFGVGTAQDTSLTTRRFKNFSVTNCKFSGFNIDIDIRATDGVKLFNNEHTGSIYSRGTGAVAGYQAHIASCSNVEHAHNKHISGGFDRHALYIATAQAGVNLNINSHDNVYEWDNTDYTQNPFMSAINIRPGNNIHIHHETIISPHGGGITSVTDSSNDFNSLLIDHNIITDITTEATASVPVVVGSGISIRPSGGGNYYNAVIDHNVITTVASPDGSRINAISISGVDTKVEGNKITLNGAPQNAINVALGTTRLSVDKNTFIGDGTQISPMFFDLQVAANDFRWGENIINGFTGSLLDTFNGAPTYSESVVSGDVTIAVTSDGVGGITYTSTLPVVTSITSIAAGFSITFPDWFKPADKAKQLSSGTNLARTIYEAGSSGTVNNFAVLDSSGTQIPAATNAYTIYVTYKDLRQ